MTPNEKAPRTGTRSASKTIQQSPISISQDDALLAVCDCAVRRGGAGMTAAAASMPWPDVLAAGRARTASMPQPDMLTATTPPCTVCGVVCETCTRHLDRLMRHRDTLLIWLSQGAELHLNASEYYFALGFAYEHIDERAQEVIEFDRHEHFLKRCDELRQASGVELERLINEWGAF